MDHREGLQPLDPPREARRRFLKQIATTGVIAGAGALPSLAQAQEKPASSSPSPGSTSAAASAAHSNPTSGPTVAETLARYATSLRYEDIPPDLVREAKRFLIDWSAAGSAASAPSRARSRTGSPLASPRNAGPP